MTQTWSCTSGYPKTGTTSVQWFLHARREDLRRQDVRAFADATRLLPMPTRLMSAAALDQLRTKFADANRRLAEDFVHQPLDGFWFPAAGGQGPNGGR